MSSRAFGLARPLARSGHQVRLFMPPWQRPGEADRNWEEDGVEFRYTPLQGGTWGITRRLIQETLAWKPDVVHCFKPKAYSGLVAWWLWQFQRRRVRLVVDSDDWEGRGGWNDRMPYTQLQKLFFSWQEQWGMSHCHSLTVASKVLQSIALSHGISSENVVYIPNGSGFTSDKSSSGAEETKSVKRRELGVEGRPVLLLYSRLFEFDTSRLATILTGVKTAVPNVAILSIGESLIADDAVKLREKLEETGVLEAVVDLGWIDLDDLPFVLNSADTAIYLMDDTLLNRTKCPVKLADLLSVGIPVVAEAVGQVPEYVINGRTGFLREPGDVDGLIADMVSLIQNKPQRAQMAAASRAHYAENFSWDRLANRLKQAYGWS